ncbi:MAG TPA: fasciclin domain-containing protein [Bacteroidales bacterium]|nr:fasciclin domain-containing protein [Bacteroidales bacterium]
MKLNTGILGIIFLLSLAGCNKDWDEHYGTQPPSSNTNVWDAMQQDGDLSSFVSYMKEFKYDTLFLTDNTYTVFAPDNSAFDLFLESGSVSGTLLDYHISTYFIQSGSIQGKRKIQTLAEKFALFVNNNNANFLDDIPLFFESPLYRNGKYFKMGSVALPRPNLYEYIAGTNPILKRYIDSKDSVILDRALSRPIGFDEQGNTIYDTVSVTLNLFEYEYFPVKHEFRYETATIVFPKESNYNSALTAMAQSMSSNYNDYSDIPLAWQNEILIPYLLEHGVFENMLEREEFLKQSARDTVKLKNVLGDSVVIDYLPVEKTICSNGYAYNYANFKIPDTLYNSPVRMEGEFLLEDIGINRYAWKEEVDITNDIAYQPLKEYVPSASNDTTLKVNFTKGYSGRFIAEFNVDNLFPRRYLMVFRTHMYVGGIYEIYVNGQLVKTIDYYTFVLNREISYSVIPGKRYLPQSGYNRFDCWVENLTEYGKAKIKIVYKGPSTVLYNGLVIDYIDFIPYN